MATKNQMLVLTEQFPELTASDIADLLGCNSGWVRSTAKRNDIKLPNGNFKQNSETGMKRATAKVEAEKYVRSDEYKEAIKKDE